MHTFILTPGGIRVEKTAVISLEENAVYRV
jgi:hypothetical protein